METFGELVKSKKIVNRGFLIGPYCPIYGVGVLLITNLLHNYTKDILILFFMSMIICGLLEYITSYFMEKLFNARWWDYSNNKFNINGRICLETLIPFGIAGCLITLFSNPFLISIYSLIPDLVLHIISAILLLVFIIDNIISFNVVIKIKNTIYNSLKDNTEEISIKVKDFLLKGPFLIRRLLDAFPDLKATIKEKKELLMEKTQELKENLKEKSEDIKGDLKEKTYKIKNTLKEKTENLKGKFDK